MLNGQSHVGVKKGIPVTPELRERFRQWKRHHGLTGADIASMCNLSQTLILGIAAGRVTSCHIMTIRELEQLMDKLP